MDGPNIDWRTTQKRKACILKCRQVAVMWAYVSHPLHRPTDSQAGCITMVLHTVTVVQWLSCSILRRYNHSRKTCHQLIGTIQHRMFAIQPLATHPRSNHRTITVPECVYRMDPQITGHLTFWRRNYFFFNFSTPVYKM